MKENLKKYTVVVIEDDQTIAASLYDIFSILFKRVEIVDDGCEALEFIRTTKPDIIISDIKLPCLDGLELVREIKTEVYNPFIAITSAFSDQSYLLEAIDIQVHAYFVKPVDINELVMKIENFFYPKNTQKAKEVLSQREFEVFLDLAKGLKPAQIAQKLSVKPKTVSTYRERIFEKMDFKSNAELVGYAAKTGYI